MRGQPHPDNDQMAHCKSCNVFRILRGTVLSAMVFFRETSKVDPQVKDGVSERLISLARAVLGAGSVIPNPFPLDAQLSDLGISSLKLVNLMLAVEVEFDISIAQADITPENFHSLQTIEMLVDRTLARRA
jgi:acyl carrier protein